MAYKRARKSTYSKITPYAKRGSGRTGIKRRRVTNGTSLAKKAYAGVARLTKMIETKDNCWKTAPEVALAHNNLVIIQAPGSGGRLNVLQINQGASDGMANGGGARVGDAINVRGVLIRGMFENALARPKVYYRLMLIRSARGDAPTRATLFRDNAGNKMIDQINTERFTIVAEKIFNCYGQGSSIANSVSGGGGAPLEAPTIAGDYVGGIGSKLVSMWIPGRKFGRNGYVQYENNSTIQVKFYDYSLGVVAYDWYGTPQDINTVGKINELYSKLYFKDA